MSDASIVMPALHRFGLIVRCAFPRCPHGVVMPFGPESMSGPVWFGRYMHGEYGWRICYDEAPANVAVLGVWGVNCWHHVRNNDEVVLGKRSQPFALRCGWPGCSELILLPWGPLADESALARLVPVPWYVRFVMVRTSPLTKPGPVVSALCSKHGAVGADDALAKNNPSIGVA